MVGRRILILLALLVWAWGASAWAQPAAATEPPSQPMLRIDTGGVIALPRAAAADEAAARLYSAGDDKAVRVWRLPDLRLLDTWYLPSAEGPEGQVNAVALTPDGRHLAVGGWTGYTWDRAVSLYIFETASGRIVQRLTGLPGVVGALRFAADGEQLLIGLVGKGGVLGVRWRDAALRFHDRDYTDSVLGVDVAGDRGVAVGMDGALRVYDLVQGRRLLRHALTEGELPTRVRFHPDGRRVAIGFHGSLRVSVHDVAALLAGPVGAPLWSPPVAGIQGQRNLSVVAWSADGRRLLAGGDPGEAARSQVFTWDTGASAPARATPVATQRLSALLGLGDGSWIVLAEDPGIARVQADGRVVQAGGAGVRDHREAGASLRVSADAARVGLQYPLAQGGVWGFDLAELRMTPSAAAAAPPVPAAGALPVQWQAGQAQVQLDGRPTALEPYEFVRDVSHLPDGAPILGTEFGVRLYDRAGALRWFTSVGGIAWAVRASADGRHVVAAVSDGTLRWLRVRDGALVLSLFAHARSGEWVAWTPDGHYASSPYGDELIGWQINRSKRERADFYHAAQFERLLYRPDIVRAALADQPPARVRSARGLFDIRQLAAIAPPTVRISGLEPVADPARRGLMRVRVSATRAGGAMRRYVVFVDDIPVTPAAQRPLRAGEADAFERVVEFTPLTPGGTVRVEVATDQAIGVAQLPLPLDLRPVRQAALQGDLYVLAIGVRQFPALPRAFELFYTERDAQEVGRFFAGQAGGLYRQVHTRIVSDDAPIAPTREAIVASLDFLKRAGPQDTVILFLASHGVRDAQNQYFFATADSRTEDLCAILRQPGQDDPPYCQGKGRGGRPDRSFIEWQVFFDALADSAGRRLLVVDTCEAGNIRGRSEIGSLRKRSASSRFALLLAAGDGEDSQEYRAGQHGLFTYAMLKALSGGAPPGPGGVITLENAYGFVRQEVERLRDRRVGPMTPNLEAPALLRQLPLAQVGQPARRP